MSDLEEAMAPRSLSFVVPGDPQGQAALSRGRNGGMYHSNKKLEPWRECAAWEIKAAMRRERVQMVPRSVPVSVSAKFYCTKPPGALYDFPAEDGDHLIRALGDALQFAGLLKNDAQVVEWRARKHYGEPRTEVTVWVEP